MRLLDSIRFHLRTLTAWRRVEHDIDRNLAFHLEMETARLLAAGIAPDEASRQARVALGGEQRFREESREAAASPPRAAVEQIGRDLRYAARAYVAQPGFALVVLATLALGIGATTVIYSVTDHIVLRGLPYANADRLANVQVLSDRLKNITGAWAPNAAHYLAWKRECTVCERLVAIRPISFMLTGAGDAAAVAGARVSDDFFATLGAHADVGRLFAAGDDRPGNEHLAVISDGLWRERFGGRGDIVGRTATLNDVPWTIIGVLAPDFHMLSGKQLGDFATLPSHMDIFVPLALTPREQATAGEHSYGVIALVRQGATMPQLRTQLDLISARHAVALHDDTPSRTLIEPLKTRVVGAAGRPLVLLLAAVGALLLIMCVNLASLFLARAQARRREWALRIALGASRARVVRQALTETVLLACVGGGFAAMLSRLGVHALVALAPADLPRLDQVHVDARVLLVALGVSIAVGIALGLLPALRVARTSPDELLKDSSRGASAGTHSARARNWLIASQIGISALLLIGAGLFLKSFERAIHADRGFTAERVLAVTIALPPKTYRSAATSNAVYEEIIRRAASLPGVTAAGLTNGVPLEGENWIESIWRPGEDGARGHDVDANFRFVSASYFSLMGVPILAGRAFTDADRGGHPMVVLSENAAHTLWPRTPLSDVIGQPLRLGGTDSTYEVIGIVPNVRTTGIEHEGSLTAYTPYWERGYATTLLVRTNGDPTALAGPVRAVLHEAASEAAVARVRTIHDVLSRVVAQRRFELVLIALFAATALLTACLGIYGVIAHSLGRRRNEIGIRLALGAVPRQLELLVVREMLGPISAGLAAGVIAALITGRFIATLLYEVRPTDQVTLTGVVVAVGLTALVAAWLPAREASRLDPARALRNS